MNQIARCDWPPVRARWSHLARSYNKSFIDQVCLIKMAGYWPRLFFASLVVHLDFFTVHKHAKKELDQYPAILTSHLVNNRYILTEKARSIKDLLFGFQGNFSRATGPVVPGGQDSTVHLLSTSKVSFS